MDYANIPQELKEIPCWVVWGINKDKPKIPYNPKGITPAKVDDPTTWSSYDDATARVISGEAQGVGFVFNNAGYYGVDLDDVFLDGVLKPEAQAIVEQLDSYTELSVSGTGLHIIVRADGITLEHHRKCDIEIYDNLRYFIMTGDIYGNPKPISKRTVELQTISNQYLKPTTKLNTVPTAVVHHSDVSEIIGRIMRSKSKEKFDNLFNKGNWQAEYPSPSEADLALCNLLAYWTKCNGVIMDIMFRQSKLMRLKWDEQRGSLTYGEATIQEAINNFVDFGSIGLKYLDTQPSVRPYDYSDSGNAEVFVRVYKEAAIYVKALGWLVWNGKKWVENDLSAVGLAVALTKRMRQEAIEDLNRAKAKLAQATANSSPSAKDIAEQDVQKAMTFVKHVKTSRGEPQINRMLKLARSQMYVEFNQLDASPYLLNTPAGVVNLTDGAMYPHDPAYYCTKITRCSPNMDNMQMWQDFLDTITDRDMTMQEFHQDVAGMSAHGRVYMENLVIPYGRGKNGKSTLYNSEGYVLGDYAGSMDTELITTRNSSGFDMVNLQGKRLVLAAELNEDRVLSTGMLKKLASTDPIYAARKYKDAERFEPSHSLVLYTNILPKVRSMDNGTWRRIVVVPFNSVIPSTADIKNYAYHLAEHAGGAILSWIIDGAVRFHRNKYTLNLPQVVKDAILQYRNQNDTVGDFIQDCCTCGNNATVMSGVLYEAHRNWALQNGEIPKTNRDFKYELELRGFTSSRTNNGVCWYGITVKQVSTGGRVGLV